MLQLKQENKCLEIFDAFQNAISHPETVRRITFGIKPNGDV